MLRDRPFRLYLIGQTVSGLGTALSGLALAFAVLSLSASASALGLVLLASRLPGVAFMLAGGVLADRMPRRRVSAGCDGARAVLQATTALLLLSGRASVLCLAAGQLLAGACGAVFAPASAALAAELAPGGQVRRAGSLVATARASAQTGGLALSGVLVAVVGPGIAFAVDGLSFAISAGTLMLLPPAASAPQRRAGRGFAGELREGWRALAAHGWPVVAGLHETVLDVLAIAPFLVLGPLVAAQRLGGAPAWSAIVCGYAVGSLAGAHLTYRWAPRRPVLAALVSSLALVPVLVLLALGAPVWLDAPAALMAGWQATLYNALLAAALQSNLPEAVLARASALSGIGSTVLAPAAIGVAGLVAAQVGAGAVLGTGAGAIVVVTILCVRVRSVRAPLELDRVPAGVADSGAMESVFAAAGGADGMLSLAHAWHRRVLADEVVGHAFSHGFRPDHTERLAAYLGEALGGPADYSARYGDESFVVRQHSGNGEHVEMDRRAIACWAQALDDVGIPPGGRLGGVLYDYFAWATNGPMARYHASADDVPAGLAIPRWSWDGLIEE